MGSDQQGFRELKEQARAPLGTGSHCTKVTQLTWASQGEG